MRLGTDAYDAHVRVRHGSFGHLDDLCQSMIEALSLWSFTAHLNQRLRYALQCATFMVEQLHVNMTPKGVLKFRERVHASKRPWRTDLCRESQIVQ